VDAAVAISTFCFLLSALYGRDAMATDEHGFARMNRTVGLGSREAAKPRRGKSRGQATDAVGPHSMAGMPWPRMNTDLHG
jgi:hypothetical protein